MKDTNQALLGKVAWRLMKDGRNPWSEVLGKKYMGGRNGMEEGPISRQGSAIWKAIKDKIKEIKNKCRWQLGDGEEIQFWEAKWLKDHPLQEDEQVRSLAEEAKRAYGERVKDYMEGTGTGKRWKEIKTQEEEKSKILNSWLKGVYIPKNPRKDKLIWGGNNDGEYSVKSGYEQIRARGQEEEVYKKIWKNKATPKTVMFLWASVRNGILTLDNLQKRGWCLANRCILCKKEEETVDHLLVKCPYTQEVWELALQDLQVDWVPMQKWKDFVVSWSAPYYSKRLSILWDMALAQVAWNIWKERNRRTFEDKEKNPRILWGLIKTAIKENMQGIKSKGGKEKGTEEKIRRIWNLEEEEKGKDNPRDGVQWVPPPEGWKKLNFDGAAKGNPGEAGGGGVLRDHKGKVIWAYSGYFGYQTNHRAEMMAMTKGVEGCSNRVQDKLIIEGDSMNIINLLKGKTKPDWRSETLIEEVREIVAKWTEVKIQHTYREGNGLADKLANRGVAKKDEEEWEGELPEGMQEESM